MRYSLHAKIKHVHLTEVEILTNKLTLLYIPLQSSIACKNQKITKTIVHFWLAAEFTR